MTEKPLVDMEIRRGRALITLNDPQKRNALSRRLLHELSEALREAEGDSSVRCLVLTGAAPAFCAGADLSEQRDGLPPGPVSLPEILAQIATHRCPVVARVNGPARAGGLGLVAACDIAVGLRESTFSFTEVRIGVVPAVISLPVLERIPAYVAREYFLTGEVFDGLRAQEVGLLNRAVDPDELDDTVANFVDMLSLGGPHALAETKRLFVRPQEELAAEYAELLSLSSRMFSADEGQEGIRAFREKRPASWVLE